MFENKGSAQLMNELDIDNKLMEKALELAGGDTRRLSAAVSESLKAFINKARLEASGYREMLFHLNRHDEVKHIFARRIAQLELKNDEMAHLNDPYFCGVIYPSTMIEVFLTVKGNLLVQKSVSRVLHYANGRVIRDYSLLAPQDTEEERKGLQAQTPYIISLTIHGSLETMRKEIPEAMYPTVAGAYHSRMDPRLREELDEEFYEQMEL